MQAFTALFDVCEKKLDANLSGPLVESQPNQLFKIDWRYLLGTRRKGFTRFRTGVNSIHRGGRYLTGDDQKVVWAKFSNLM